MGARSFTPLSDVNLEDTMEKQTEAITVLITKAVQADTAEDALRFAQAASHVAGVFTSIHYLNQEVDFEDIVDSRWQYDV